MLCGYKTGHLLLLPALVFYLMLCGEGNLRFICPGLPQIKRICCSFFPVRMHMRGAIDRPASQPRFLYEHCCFFGAGAIRENTLNIQAFFLLLSALFLPPLSTDCVAGEQEVYTLGECV